jgi:hypothetical protein
MDGGGRATQEAKAEGWGEGIIRKNSTLHPLTQTLPLRGRASMRYLRY